MNNRSLCVICESQNLHEFHRLSKMPVFMGTVPNEIDYKFQEMSFTECLNCGGIQLGSYPDISDVYLRNHNVDIVGNLWNLHFDSFSQFIGNVENKKILEISDPSAKLAKRCKGFKKWTIIELNPSFETTDNIDVIKSYFSKEITINFEVDIVVHSHFFEHSLNPNEDLRKIWEILPKNGEMFFSIPDLKSLIEKSKSPTAINFEHTYYYDFDLLRLLLINNGFYILDIKKFKNHSIFIHAKKKSLPLKKISIKYIDRKKTFIDCFEFHKKNIESINNNLLKNHNTFIYGSHVTSQFYIFNGLNLQLSGILDKSNSKNGEILYGTNLKTLYPEEILNYKNLSVIVSHSSVYKDEIINNIRSFDNGIAIFH